MAARKSPANNFQDRYFDQMDDNFKDLKGDIKEVKDETRAITRYMENLNDRLIKVEDKVFPAHAETVQQLPPIWRDPQIIKLATYIALAFLVLSIIFAALKGVTLPKGIFG